MDEEVIRKQTIRKVGRKFYGHDSLYSKYTPQIPEAAEREYMRMTNEYMRLLKEELEENLPELKESYKANRDELVADNRRMDAATDFKGQRTVHKDEIKPVEKDGWIWSEEET